MNSERCDKFYITTPIYYVNGLPHVGTALTTVACDVLARFHRLRGADAYLLTGTDENGTKIQEAAELAGVPPLVFVEQLAGEFQQAWSDLGVEANDFIRTTESRHTRAVQEFFSRLLASGTVYKDVYEGWYSVSDETFYRDSDVENGVAKETGKPVERVTEENYFFRLSAFSDRLLAHIRANPWFLSPDFRRNEVIRFIEEGLRDMCITRSNKGWGIPFPGDESKVVYVWFDALISYLSATGWPDQPNWQNLWPADLHFMGKEIFVRFHATLWPAMLMALELPLPVQVFAHGFWTLPWLKPGEKAGKSTGGLPHPTTLSRFLAERTGIDFVFAADALRYLLCREMNFGLDTEFTVENFLRRFNTDLANDLGNLLNRTINMVVRYYDGAVPEPPELDHEVAALATKVREEYVHAMEELRLNVALEAVWKLVARMNKYIDEQAPWTLAKSAASGSTISQDRLAVTLATCLETTRVVSVLLSPFMPRAAAAISLQLGLTPSGASWSWAETAWTGLPSGTRVRLPEPLFPRIQELTIDEATLVALGVVKHAIPHGEGQQEKGLTVSDNQPTRSATSTVPGAPISAAAGTAFDGPISIEDFSKVQLKVGEVLAAEPVPNATKLLRLTVQMSDDDIRTILAGIAEFYTPDELVGRQVVVVANLHPRKMRGIESQGMLLAADVDGRAVLVRPETTVPLGARVR